MRAVIEMVLRVVESVNVEIDFDPIASCSCSVHCVELDHLRHGKCRFRASAWNFFGFVAVASIRARARSTSGSANEDLRRCVACIQISCTLARVVKWQTRTFEGRMP